MSETYHFEYLHQTSDGMFYLDHRLNPSVRAMLCAMASRMPAGGIEARYHQIVEAVAEGLTEDAGYPTLSEMREDPSRKDDLSEFLSGAEEELCKQAVHPKVQQFFDKFVLMYGHSSIMELTGSPSVYTQDISWYTAWLLFDSPLCSGQEFSTRAVRRKDWPLARECYVHAHHDLSGDEVQEGPFEDMLIPDPRFQELHDLWMDIFEAEVESWKDHLSDPEVRASFGIADKEPFRPALDRARWAIPGTIATGCSHTGHLRERSRVLRDGYLLAQKSNARAAIETWEAIRYCYAQAAPGLAHMGLREAVYDADNSRLPSHFHVGTTSTVAPAVQVNVTFTRQEEATDFVPGREPGQRAYLDAWYNNLAQVDTRIRCSLAVARDWHRHRTMYPWTMDLVLVDDRLSIAGNYYTPMSEFGKANVERALQMATDLYAQFMAEGNQYMALHCLPLGTEVELRGQAGLRDAVYCFELRRDAHGANFEYKAQAEEAMLQLTSEVGPENATEMGLALKRSDLSGILSL